MLNYIFYIIFLIPLCFVNGSWNVIQNLLFFGFLLFLVNIVFFIAWI